MELDKINDKVQKIQEDLRKVKETVLSEAKRKEKIEEIKRRAEKTKKELEKSISTLKDKTKEEAKTILNSLNEIINFKLSIGDATSGNTDSGTVGSDGNAEKGIFDKAKDWVKEQRDATTLDNLKKEPGKTMLRGIGFALTGIGAFALTVKGVRSLWNRAFGKDKAEKKEESEKKSGEEKEKKGFWDRWYGKAIKYSVIGTGIYYVIHGIKTGKWNYKDFTNRDNKPEISIEEKLQKLNGLENECKGLKEGAERCLNLSRTKNVDHVKNKEEYDGILKRACVIRDEAKTNFDEISGSNTTAEEKQQAETLKNNIDNYVKEIEAMKEEIYKNVPEDENGGNNNGGGNNPDNNGEGGNETVEYEPVSASAVTQATIDFFDTNAKKLSLDDKTKEKLKENMNKYFESYPILKKDKNNNMKFEIENKTEFSKMIKQSWNDILAGLPWYKSEPLKAALKVCTKDGLDNVDTTVKGLGVKYYENMVFKYVGGVVKNVAKQEKGNIKVQDFYDSISKSYPNKNASVVAKDLASSGQANKDIKEFKYPFA